MTERVKAILAVNVPNASVLGLIHLLDIKTVGEIVLVTISIAYTIWRWRRDARRHRR